MKKVEKENKRRQKRGDVGREKGGQIVATRIVVFCAWPARTGEGTVGRRLGGRGGQVSLQLVYIDAGLAGWLSAVVGMLDVMRSGRGTRRAKTVVVKRTDWTLSHVFCYRNWKLAANQKRGSGQIGWMQELALSAFWGGGETWPGAIFYSLQASDPCCAAAQGRQQPPERQVAGEDGREGVWQQYALW